MRAITFLFISILFVVSCTHTQPKPEGWTVSIMAYNSENFFDTVDDADRDDETYLPLSLKNSNPKLKATCKAKFEGYRAQECLETDWSNEILEVKLNRLKDVIEQVGGGKGPDILLLEEVENINVLTQLNAKLNKSNYQTVVLIEGPDKRGIDIGLLSRLPLKDQPILHKIEFNLTEPKDIKSGQGTRGILQTNLLLPDGQTVHVFGVHFPSQGNSTILRKQAAAFLNKLKSKLPEGSLVIAGGDFNITAEEDILQGYVSKDLSSEWLVSHLIGCKDCQGSHYYGPKDEWSFLDLLLFSKSMDPKTGIANYRLNPGSIKVLTGSKYQMDRFLKPARFNSKTSVGVSDHLPIYAEFERVDLK